MAFRADYSSVRNFIFWTIASLAYGAYEPTNLVCTPKNSTILEFTWTLPAGGAGVVQGYHLDLVRTDNVKIDILPTVTINGYYVDTYTFYGLGKYAEYTLTMHSFTASGNQADVTSVCRTLEDIPDGAPSGVNATGISYSEIYVEWLELEDFYRNGVLAGYKIVYFDYSSDNPHEITVSSSTLSYTIANLNYDTWYVVSVLGYTSAGDGPRTTDPDKTWGLITNAPDGVTKYYCYQAIPDTLEIAWDSMPCTIYVGIIGALFVFMMIFMCACCSQCCGKEKEKKTEEVVRTRNIYHGMGGPSIIKVKMMNFKRRVRDKKNSVSPHDEDEGFCDDEDDGGQRNKGDVTARDIHMTEDNELKRETPPPAKIPVLSKRMAREPSSFDLEMGNTEDPIQGVQDKVTAENETGNAGGKSGKGNGIPKPFIPGPDDDEVFDENLDPELYPGKAPDFTMLRNGDGFF